MKHSIICQNQLFHINPKFFSTPQSSPTIRESLFDPKNFPFSNPSIVLGFRYSVFGFSTLFLSHTSAAYLAYKQCSQITERHGVKTERSRLSLYFLTFKFCTIHIFLKNVPNRQNLLVHCIKTFFFPWLKKWANAVISWKRMKSFRSTHQQYLIQYLHEVS